MNSSQSSQHDPVRQAQIDSILKPALGPAGIWDQVPHRFEPFGGDSLCPGTDPDEIPQSLDQLGELKSYAHNLTVHAALKLDIPVVGSVSGGYDRRVIVYEWTLYKDVNADSGIICRYGCVIRFCVTVNKWDVQANLGLPFMSAQAELGMIEAAWMMQVRGLAGKKISSVILPPKELRVETFVLANQSLEAAIAAIWDPDTKFVPGIVVGRVLPPTQADAYWQSVVEAFALTCVRRGRTRATAQSRLQTDDPVSLGVLTDTYAYFAIDDPQQRPGSGSQRAARSILRGIEADR